MLQGTLTSQPQYYAPRAMGTQSAKYPLTAGYCSVLWGNAKPGDELTRFTLRIMSDGDDEPVRRIAITAGNEIGSTIPGQRGLREGPAGNPDATELFLADGAGHSWNRTVSRPVNGSASRSRPMPASLAGRLRTTTEPVRSVPRRALSAIPPFNCAYRLRTT